MTNVYIDFERDHNDRIIEIGAVATKDRQVIMVFHAFIKQPIEDIFRYNSIASHSHCIHPKLITQEGQQEESVKERFYAKLKELQSENGKVTIVGFGLDTTQQAIEKWNPFLKSMTSLVYRQISLPLWKHRGYEKFHIAAFAMKQTCQLFTCHAGRHTLRLSKPESLWKYETDVLKYIHGAHCALMDAFELAFYEGTLPLYQSNNQFQYICAKVIF